MKQLPNWLIANPIASAHDFESLTVLEQTARLYNAVRSLIDEYTAFTESVSKQIQLFQEEEKNARETFQTDLTKVIREFMCNSPTAASAAVRVVEIALPAGSWEGGENLYSQVVAIDGITEYSKVDLTPSVDQLAVFYEKDISFLTENNGGVVTVYVVGQRPENDYTMQATITEVSV